MTTQNHTSGLLKVDPKYPEDVLDADGSDVFTTYTPGGSGVKPLGERFANARRLVACWNACDGVSAEILGAGAVRDLLADLREAAATLRRYEALHRAKGTAESTEKAEVNAALAARFEATIAKATGGAS